jgi:hypothetical protein
MLAQWNQWILKHNKTDVDSYKNLKWALGILGLALPLVCIVGGLLSPWHEIQISISHTYHTNLRDVLIGILACVAVVFMTHQGYGLFDNLVTWVIGAAAAGVALFPCPINPQSPADLAVAASVTATTNGNPAFVTAAAARLPVGVFNLSQNAAGLPHLLSAGAFFFLVSFYLFFVLTVSKNDQPKPRKKIRNLIYRLCGIIIFACMVFLIVVVAVDESFLANTHLGFICESIMLFAFGFAWLVKAGLPGFRDRKEDREAA